MDTLKITTSKRVWSMPVSWAAVTVDMYQKIVEQWDGEDMPMLISILTGVHYYDVALINNEELIDALMIGAQFINVNPDFEGHYMMRELLGVEVMQSNDMPALSIGQAISMRQAMEGKPAGQVAARLAAIYLQPLVDKATFDSKRVKDIEAQLLQLPIHHVAPLSFFYAKRLRKNGVFIFNVWSQMRLSGLKKTIQRQLWRLWNDLTSSLNYHSSTSTRRSSDWTRI